MPLLRLTSNATECNETSTTELLCALSAVCAEQLGKSESKVMTTLTLGAPMTFAATDALTCFVELKSIGEFQPAQTRGLAIALSELVTRHLGVARNRIYIEFTVAQRHLWAADGAPLS